MAIPRNAAVFFEIPVLDFQRAHAFYSKILATKLETIEKRDPPRRFAPLPHQAGGVGGALAEMEGMVPSEAGTLIYLDGGQDLEVILKRVEAAGGRVLKPKTFLQEHCFYAYFADTEGNRVGLFSPT